MSYTDESANVIAAESKHIEKPTDTRRVGFSISGGGIRSASFAMGVMQAMVGADALKKMDYLSTVSGGGYLGSSLTYFLSQTMADGKPYGTEKHNFPFGKVREGNKINKHNKILDFIRQHGNYLAPDNKLNILSLIAVLLRTVLVSFSVYFALVTGLIVLLLNSGVSHDMIRNTAFGAAVFLLMIWLVCAFLYSLYTYSAKSSYKLSVASQIFMGWLFAGMILSIVIGLIPILYVGIHTMLPEVLQSQFSATHTGTALSGLSLVSGLLLSVISHVKQTLSTSTGISPIQIVLAAIFLLFSILLGAFVAGEHITNTYSKNTATTIGIGLLLGSLIFGLFCNVNLFGLNRMYRNRLMETFMPDEESIDNGRWKQANVANKTLVENMCQTPNNRPYHLVNCNIVLVDSDNPKYRGRKGDSFTLSPLYCGSDATGWRQTTHWLKNTFRKGITLPTAMAISGAAANGNSGVDGRGVTVNKYVSTVMSLLSLRLGFWADNPKCNKPFGVPNFFYPGLKGGLLFKGLNQYDRNIELSDGGHFENLGVYELLRRRLDLIIVSDAGADGNFEFADLANLLERARVDFGLKIQFREDYSFSDIIPNNNLKQTAKDPTTFNLSERAFAIARIEYRKDKVSDPRQIGHIIYIKPTMIQNLPPDVVGYKKEESTFPHQSTLDQFFSERQFEAYRELGYYIGWSALENEHVQNLLSEQEVEWKTEV